MDSIEFKLRSLIVENNAQSTNEPLLLELSRYYL